MGEVKDREIVIPGQLIGENAKAGSLCYAEDNKVYSLVRGLVRTDKDRVNVIPVRGPYIPKVGDMVIGPIVEDFGEVYLVDIKGAYYSVIKEERRMGRGGGRHNDKKPEKYNLGELISGKVRSVNEVHESKLTGVWRLEGGLTIEVDPKKVPRIIGKHRSMINMIKEKTGCNIAVGQNGLIWINKGRSNLAVDAIRKIESEAHTSGLTDRITESLSKKVKKSDSKKE